MCGRPREERSCMGMLELPVVLSRLFLLLISPSVLPTLRPKRRARRDGLLTTCAGDSSSGGSKRISGMGTGTALPVPGRCNSTSPSPRWRDAACSCWASVVASSSVLSRCWGRGVCAGVGGREPRPMVDCDAADAHRSSVGIILARRPRLFSSDSGWVNVCVRGSLSSRK